MKSFFIQFFIILCSMMFTITGTEYPTGGTNPHPLLIITSITNNTNLPIMVTDQSNKKLMEIPAHKPIFPNITFVIEQLGSGIFLINKKDQRNFYEFTISTQKKQKIILYSYLIEHASDNYSMSTVKTINYIVPKSTLSLVINGTDEIESVDTVLTPVKDKDNMATQEHKQHGKAD